MRATQFILACLAIFCLMIGTRVAPAHGGRYPPKNQPRTFTTNGGQGLAGKGLGGGSGGESTGGPGGAVTPAPGGRGPATPGGKKNHGATTFDRWESWWELNRDPYLLLRTQADSRVKSGPQAFLTGVGRRVEAAPWSRPTRDQLHDTIIPALKAGVHSGEKRIADSAILALGKVTPTLDAPLVADDLKGMLGSPHLSVRQAAILGLALLGDRSELPVLWGIMNDTTAGRKLTGSKGAVLDHDRAIAALALGFSQGGSMAPQLCRLIERSKDVELVGSAVLSLGMMHDAAGQTVPFLSSLLENKRLDARVRAQIPISLARLGEISQTSLPLLMRLVENEDEVRDVRISAVIAIGRLATADDDHLIQVVRKLIARSHDAQLRHFAIMTFGRIGASVRALATSDEAGERVLRYLSAEISDPRNRADLPWAVLAAGIAGYELSASSKERVRIAEQIITLMKRTNNPSHEGAMAIALGLLDLDAAGPHLQKRLQESHDTNLQGCVAVGLGLMRFRGAADELRALVTGEKTNAELRITVATDLGAMGDGIACGSLLDMLSDSPTFAETVSIARALGQIGDSQAVERLAALALDPTRKIEVRSYSCVALGLIAEKTSMPWNTPLSVDANYLVSLQSQSEVLNLF